MTVDFAVLPERTALINVDLQNCFVDGAPGELAAMDLINRLAAPSRDDAITML